VLDEIDLAIVDALQVSPRAPWAAVADAVGVSADTVARHWRALSEAGLAWVNLALSGARTRGAIVTMACRSTAEERVAVELARLPHVVTVGLTTGRHQVVALVLAPTVASVGAAYLAMTARADVVDARIETFDSVWGGVAWELGVIGRTVRESIRPQVDVDHALEHRLSPDDRDLFLALGEDGRRSYTDLAAELDRSPVSVKRRIRHLERAGDIVFRSDVARRLAGWECQAIVWMSVPPLRLAEVGREVAAWPEVRMCSRTTGPTNLVVIAELRRSAHLDDLVLRLAATYEDLTVVDRQVLFRLVKVHGRVVDEWGRAVEVVPVDPWWAARPG
jgi:DNA-binding Lrp family transcriptional regulator